MYSREWNRDVQYRGRVRVQLKQEDGSLCLVQFPSRKLFFFFLNEQIKFGNRSFSTKKVLKLTPLKGKIHNLHVADEFKKGYC